MKARALEGAAGAILMALAAALGAGLRHRHGPVLVDEPGQWMLNQYQAHAPPIGVTNMLSHIGDPALVVASILLLAAVAGLAHRRWSEPVAVIVAAGAAVALGRIGKVVVDRTLFAGGRTFPSGHVGGTAVVCAAALLVVRHRRALVVWLVGLASGLVLLSAVVGAIATSSHVLTDVVGGVFVGAGSALIAWAALVPLPWEARPVQPASLG